MEVDSQNENLNTPSQPSEQIRDLTSSDSQVESAESLLSDQEELKRSKAKNIVLIAGIIFFVITLIAFIILRFEGLNQ